MTKTLLLSGLAALLLAACGSDSSPVGGPDEPNGDSGTPPPPTTSSIALARTTIAGATHLVLVISDDGDAIDGSDLGVLDGTIMARVMADGLAGILEAAVSAPDVHVAYAALLPPVEVTAASVDVVANYPDPMNVADQPFLFPNVAVTSPAVGRVEAADLLDYQVELCVVLGQDAATPGAFTAAAKGFFLCEHMIDREIQLDDFDFDHPERAEGFPEATSQRGYWRTGPYLYVPRDPAHYLATAELHLAVNRDDRQSAAVSTMRWSLEEIAKQTLDVGSSSHWSLHGTPLRLIAGTKLPAGLVLVTGTPAGSAFDLDEDDLVGSALVAPEPQATRYLRAGDQLEASGTFLGRLRVTID